MASSSLAQPDLCAQKVQLLLPSHRDSDNPKFRPREISPPRVLAKQPRVEEAPLRSHLGVLEKALKGAASSQRVAVLLTESSKVAPFVDLLRSHLEHKKLLVGSMEQEWLLQAVDVIVATPKQAMDYSLYIEGVNVLLIDCSTTDHDFFPLAHTFASFYKGFEAFENTRVIRFRKCGPWCSGTRFIPASARILRLIPGSSPRAWDGPNFMSALTMFAWERCKIAVQDWSDVPLFLPGIIRGCLSSSPDCPPLVLAPKDKVERMIKLVRVCAAECGLYNLRIGSVKDGAAQIVVDCPEHLPEAPLYAERLVVIEADTLLNDSESAAKIRHLVGICFNRSFGIHFSFLTSAVDELLNLVKGNGRSFTILPQPRVTMQGVCEFFSTVENEEEKLSRVCEIWRQLPRHRMLVYCNSSWTVKWLAGEMKNQGFRAYAFCAGDQEFEPAPTFPVIVTNVYRQGYFDVINFDLPDSLDEYVERVGRDRSDNRWAKVVINIGTRAQLYRLGLHSRLGLPPDCRNLLKILPDLFPDVFKWPQKS